MKEIVAAGKRHKMSQTDVFKQAATIQDETDGLAIVRSLVRLELL